MKISEVLLGDEYYKLERDLKNGRWSQALTYLYMLMDHNSEFYIPKRVSDALDANRKEIIQDIRRTESPVKKLMSANALLKVKKWPELVDLQRELRQDRFTFLKLMIDAVKANDISKLITIVDELKSSGLPGDVSQLLTKMSTIIVRNLRKEIVDNHDIYAAKLDYDLLTGLGATLPSWKELTDGCKTDLLRFLITGIKRGYHDHIHYVAPTVIKRLKSNDVDWPELDKLSDMLKAAT